MPLKKKAADDYRKLASSIGMEWVGEKLPANTTERTDWQCKKGHVTTKSYKKTRVFPNCRRCDGYDLGQEEYLAMAAKLNYKWLGPLPKRSIDKTNWICDKGHKLEKSYSQMKRTGCQFCVYEDSRNTEEDYLELARDSNFEWLGPLPESSKIKTNWRCQRGHKFASRYNDIQQGYGCDKCNVRGTSRVELRVLVELKTIFDDVQWRHKVLNKECDIFLSTAAIAIEIDGSWWHRNSQQKDKSKNKKLSQIGIQVYRLRELPLDKVEGHDVCYKYRSPHLPAIKSLLQNILKDNPSLPEAPRINQYVESDDFSNDASYRRMIRMLPSPPPGNSLADTNPDIAAEWDYEANAPLIPEMFSRGSDKEVFWKCEKGHPSWDMGIGGRTSKMPQGCPYCSGKRVAPGESLKDLYPRLAREWHPTLNKKGPADYAPMSGVVVWWKCNKGHEWQKMIKQRSIRQTPCQICSQEKERKRRVALAKKVAKLIQAGKSNVEVAKMLNTSATTISGLRTLARELKLLDSS